MSQSYMSLNWTIIAADNGLSPVRHQDLPDSKAHRDNMGSIWGQQDPDRPHVGPMQENSFENVVCKLESILFPPQCVKFELKLHKSRVHLALAFGQ